MRSYELLERTSAAIPVATTWLLEELAEYRGKQALFAHQSPERLAALRESAIIESAVSSNRMELIEIPLDRIGTVLHGGATRDRNEEELQGYRAALEEIHGGRMGAPLEPALLRLHSMLRGDIWDAGRYKDDNQPIVERRADGTSFVRFQPVDADAAPELTRATLACHLDLVRDRRLPALVSMAASNLDLLCIHPFRDGNGRASRLLLLQQLLDAGYDVGRFVSLERSIEASKAGYYDTLHRSSQGWHEAQHDPWPYVNYMLLVLRDMYREFERRWNESVEPRGAKTARVHRAIDDADPEFTMAQIERACPGVSIDLIRRVMRSRPDVRAIGRGPGALWRKQV